MDERDATEKQQQEFENVILVVEDDESIGSMLVEALSLETPYQAMLVTDGFQAMDVLDANKPALLITDYRLPHMNGIELYDRLQDTQVLKNTPTLMISAHLPSTEELRKRGITPLNKPFELDEFLDIIESLLESRKTQQRADDVTLLHHQDSPSQNLFCLP